MPQTPTTVQAGPWRITLHPPVLVYRGTEHEHITRPNLCRFAAGAIGLIAQTTEDSGATAADSRHVWTSTDGGSSWKSAVRNADVGSYSLFSKANGEVVVMPYDSLRFGGNHRSFTGKRTTLSWQGGKLAIRADTTMAVMPKDLMAYLTTTAAPGGNGAPAPDNKPIVCFWGTIQQGPDQSWLCPGYASFAGEERTSEQDPEAGMRGMGKFSNFILRSKDEGRTWKCHAIPATRFDVPEGCSEGPCEAQLFLFEKRWRWIFRTAAMRAIFPMYYCDSVDQGKTWTKPQPLTGVDGMMDPRGLLMSGGPTVLTTGRRGSDMYLAEGDSLEFFKVDMVAHHNACLPDAPLNTVSFGLPHFFPNSGHTDVVQLGPKRLLFAYDRIPDGWRYAGVPFTAPDEIYTVVVDIE